MGVQKYPVLFVAVIFFVTLLVHNSEGLKCFVCNSAHDADCSSQVVPAKYLITCGPQTAYPNAGPFSPPKTTEFSSCRKNVFTINEQDNGDMVQNGERRIVRTCGYLNKKSSDSSCFWTSGTSNSELMCQCETDGCNSAPSLITSWATLSLFSGIATIFSTTTLSL